MKHTRRTQPGSARNAPEWNGVQISGPRLRWHQMLIKSQMFFQIRHRRNPPRAIRDRPRICTSMHCMGLQSGRLEATKKSRDALRPTQTHPCLGFDCAAHTASKMNFFSPHPPKTSGNSLSSSRKNQLQGDSQAGYEQPNDVKVGVNVNGSKTTSFSTKCGIFLPLTVLRLNVQ